MKRSRVGLRLLRRASMFVLMVVSPLLGTGCDNLYFRPARQPMPAELRVPAVLKGEGLLAKEVFLDAGSFGAVTDIRFGAFNKGAGSEVGIAGSYGAIFTDKTGKVNSRITFKQRAAHTDIIDVEGDGICEFLNRGGVGWADSALIAHDGTILWTQGDLMKGGKGRAVDDMAAGDLDNDGVLDFVIGFNGADGVARFDRHGKTVWQKPDANVWHVEISADLVDGKRRIVHSNAVGQLTVREEDGSIVSQSMPPAPLSSSSLCRWPGKKDPEYVLIAGDDAIWIVDFDGTEKAKLDAPCCGQLSHARGAPVRWAGHEKEFFAVVVHFGHGDLSVFYLYDGVHRLVYQEVFREPCLSIAALVLDESGNDTILVGGKGRVLRYRSVNKSPAKGAK